ncbi:hypothetical protein ACIRBX_01315 [Kitasatospora sp. NPDC096147]|uniref:hypothetical protein n=1 Tax=Kitasatospora sp. NPDC096147 TaxID=3364093 RepID=UPI0037FABF9B
MPPGTSRALVFVAAALLATASCGTAEQDRADREPAGRNPGAAASAPAAPSTPAAPAAPAAPSATSSGTPDRTPMPVERYALTAEQSGAIDRAKVLLANECLAGFGLDFRIPDRPPPPAEPSRRYGISDRAAARERGYHLPPPPAGAAAADGRPTEAQEAVLLGETRAGAPQPTGPDGRPVPPGGCYGDAEARLDGGPRPEADLAAAAAVDTEGFRRSLVDPAVVPAFQAWSSCMARHGHHYRDPLASVGDRAFDTPEPTEREKAVALADLDCKTETGLLQTWSAAEAAIQTRMIEERSPAMTRLSAFQQRKIGLAREAIARLGG